MKLNQKASCTGTDCIPNGREAPAGEVNLSIDVGPSVGVNAIYAPLPRNEFVIGYGASVGIGVSATIVAGNINWGASGANARQIRNAINYGLGR